MEPTQSLSFSFEQSNLDKISYRFFSKDTRYEIPPESSLKYPYSAIGLLKVEYNHNIISYRTGFMINKNTILTAGHNLNDQRTNPNQLQEKLGSPINITYYPGLSQNSSVYKPCSSIKQIYFPSNFVKNPNEDYGIIVLSENVGEQTGWFDLKIYNDELFENDIFSAGYPLNKTTNNNTCYHLFEGKGNISSVNKSQGIIVNNILTSYGQSGSPVWYTDENNKSYVIGIQVASHAFKDDEHYATMINKKRLAQINKWIESS